MSSKPQHKVFFFKFPLFLQFGDISAGNIPFARSRPGAGGSVSGFQLELASTHTSLAGHPPGLS